ncbi:hypothetical protein J7J39_02115 [bacterium]|nr:hypothetical protein [bacterium]
MKYKIKRQSKQELEPEEILLDSKKRKRTGEGRLEVPIKNTVFSIIFFIILLLLFSLFLKSFYLVEARGEELRKEAKNNYLRVIFTEAPRGIIYSSEGKPLVKNVQKNVEKEDEAGNKIVTQKFDRVYLDSKYFSHILGYLNEVSPEEIKEDSYYQSGDRIGREGIEREYEKFLRGKKGRRERVVNAKGKILSDEVKNEPVQGNNLILNINAALQKKLYDTIKEKVPDKNAVGIAINPQNGKVLALVSIPSYDNNLISEKYNEYINDPRNPLLNRAIAGRYPSGSVIKPLIGAAALQENIITPQTKVNCQGRILIPNPYGGPFTIKRDWKVHHVTDLKKAIAESCNVYFFIVGGGGYKDINGKQIEGLGIERIKKYLDLFYIEKKLDIDLPGETVGFVPTKQWFDKVQKKKAHRNWSIADVYDVSIGQGFFLTTPFHLAVALASIANGGKIYQPQIVDKITDSTGKIIKDLQVKVLRENFIKKENIESIKEGMRECVISPSGSCRQLQTLPVSSGGKTGTAEASGEPHAWFVAFAPYENPEILILIFVENGGGGARVAEPIAKEVLEWYFTKR